MTTGDNLLVLVVDDDQSEFDNLFRINKRWQRFIAETEDSAEASLRENKAGLDVVLFDLSLQGESFERGLAFLKKCIIATEGLIPFIVVTRDDRPLTYQKALDSGAVGFLLKDTYDITSWSFEIEEMVRFFRRGHPKQNQNFSSLYPPLKKAASVLSGRLRYYPDIPVFIQGEAGVGKYILANQVNNPLRLFDPDDLEAQGEILNDLQSGRPLTLASRKNLFEAMEKGKILPELFERLEPVLLDIAPLRTQPDTLIPLIDHFLSQTSVCPIHKKTFFGKPATSVFDEQALELMARYNWPYNIRELREIVQWAIRHADLQGKKQVDVDCLPLRIERAASATAPTLQPIDDSKRKAYQWLEAAERLLIEKEGVRSAVAATIGFTTESLEKRIRDYHVKYPDLFQGLQAICKQYMLEPDFINSIHVIAWYAAETESIYRLFVRHFTPAIKSYPVLFSSNNDFEPGIREELLRSKMEKAHLSLMMICVDFLNLEEYNTIVYEHLVKENSKKHHIPIIARPCGWKDIHPLNQFAPLPVNGTPITSHANMDEVLTHIVEEIKKVLDSMRR